MVDRCSEAALDVIAVVAESSTAQVTQSLNHRNLPNNDDLAKSRNNEEASKEESSDTVTLSKLHIQLITEFKIAI